MGNQGQCGLLTRPGDADKGAEARKLDSDIFHIRGVNDVVWRMAINIAARLLATDSQVQTTLVISIFVPFSFKEFRPVPNKSYIMAPRLHRGYNLDRYNDSSFYLLW